MRNLSNIDDLANFIVEADAPVRDILADAEVKRIRKDGTYWELLVYLMKVHRAELYAVIAALDGGVLPGEVAGKYTVPELAALLKEQLSKPEYAEILALFGVAGRKKGAASSGSAMGTTGA